MKKLQMLVMLAACLLSSPSLWAKAQPNQIKIIRNKKGAITSLVQANGESITFQHAAGDEYWGQSYLLPFTPFEPLEVIKGKHQQISASEDFPYRQEDLYAYNIDENKSRPLTKLAQQNLRKHLKKIASCAPKAYDFLRDLMARERIRFSPEISDTVAALVNLNDDDTIYIGSLWHDQLNGKSQWLPLEWLSKNDQDSQELRRKYFHSEYMTPKLLGHPSPSWKIVFALLHEVGHLLQHHHNDYKYYLETYTIPYLEKNSRLMGMASFGIPSEEFMQQLNSLRTLFDRYKTRIESGASYFALDALAGCPTQL